MAMHSLHKHLHKAMLQPWLLRVAAIFVLTAVSMPSRAQINTEQAVAVGRNAFYFDDYVLAIQYFNRAIKAKPYQAKPYLYRALAKLNLEDYRGAEQDASTAVELNPFLTDAWEVRGVARQYLGKDSLAITDYDHALGLLPNNRQLMFNKALAQVEIKDTVSADSTFNNLLARYPGFENGRLGYARLLLLRGDTLQAVGQIDKALDTNPKSFNGWAMRADLYIQSGRDHYPKALAALDTAIRLKPRAAGLFVNRAYLKYSLSDYFGAMADFDHALSLEPYNQAALFNRGLLEAEVQANDKALADFNAVINLDPGNVQARYNRSIILAAKHMYAEAIEDVNYVIASSPNFPTGYYMRSDYYRRAGNVAAANADLKKANDLNALLRPDQHGNVKGNTTVLSADEQARQQFAQLVKINDNTDMREEYNNSDIRGRVQDRNVSIEPEPMIELSFYATVNELTTQGLYIREVDNMNATNQLRQVVQVVMNPPTPDDEGLLSRHFRSIDDYTAYIATNNPRAIDYIGRALDYLTLRNYTEAIKDLDRAIALTPSFMPAFMLRAQARWHTLEAPQAKAEAPADFITRQGLERKIVDDVLADIDRAIELSPLDAFLYYNKANALMRAARNDEALQALNRALELKPDFGHAYFNRGYLYLKQGKRIEGTRDLSLAGEYGVAAAYNLLKRVDP